MVSDTSPKQAGGLSGALFNTFGNTAGITTPIVIGYILQATGSFAGALTFAGNQRGDRPAVDVAARGRHTPSRAEMFFFFYYILTGSVTYCCHRGMH